MRNGAIRTSATRLLIGLAGLVLFGFGLLAVVAPILFVPPIDGSLTFGLLGEHFQIPSIVTVAVWPLGLLSIVGGWLVMVGRDFRLALVAATTWAVLGFLAVVAGADIGLLLVFVLVTGALLLAHFGGGSSNAPSDPSGPNRGHTASREAT